MLIVLLLNLSSTYARLARNRHADNILFLGVMFLLVGFEEAVLLSHFQANDLITLDY